MEDVSVPTQVHEIAKDSWTPLHSASCDATDVCLLRIECGFTRGYAGLQLLGNATEVCRDGKERARAALERLGLHLPPRRLVISLTPADVRKDGNHLDLPIAVSLALLLGGRPPQVEVSRWLFAAELGLAGELRPVKGVVSFALAALAAGLDGLAVAAENLAEVSVLAALDSQRGRPLQALAFSTLGDVLDWLYEGRRDRCVRHVRPAGRGDRVSERIRGDQSRAPEAADHRLTGGDVLDFDDMLLTPELELAATAAAAGMHSLLLRGSPGTGKSMLAARLPSILPPLDRDAHVEAMRIYSSLTERLPAALLAGRPPFRAPHHQASSAAVIGSSETPGEMALAHGGVLFLDELPEFRRDLLEALREPLETGEIRVSRTKRKVVWQARVILVAACNNCPCGWSGSARQTCNCSQAVLQHYRRRLSGPILERLDIHVNMPEPAVPAAELFVRLAVLGGVDGPGEADAPRRGLAAEPSPVTRPPRGQTARMLTRVLAARSMACSRNAAFGAGCNRDLGARHFVEASGLPPARFAQLVNRRIPRTASSRSVLRCLRVARTLADLDASLCLQDEHVVQAWRWQAEPAAVERGEGVPGTL